MFYDEIMQQDGKKINNILSKLAFVCFFILIFFVFVELLDVFKKRKEAEGEIERLKNDNTALIEKKKEASILIDYFQDKNFLEKEARRRLNLQKPDERAVVVIDKREDKIAPANAANAANAAEPLIFQEKSNLPNIYRWFNLIFGRQ